jgi:hypothetical protein
MSAGMVGGAFLRRAMKTLVGLLGLACFCLSGAGAAHACSCEATSPAAGFERAQYVFTGTVIEAGQHLWMVAVDRAWKGAEKLARRVRLMDAYASMDCEFSFALGQRYLFFAVVAKGSREVFYHPQVCNWTSPLQSRRVLAPDGDSLWLEDLIVREHGPGDAPKDDRSAESAPG